MLKVEYSGLDGTGVNVELHEERKGVLNQQSGVVTVEVTQNGQDYTDSGVTFEYASKAFITKFLPDHGPIYGGTQVMIIGENFRNTSSLACKFGDEETSIVYATRFITSSAIICISPPSFKSGAVFLDVSNDGGGRSSAFSSSGMLFSYDPKLYISGVYPPLGPDVGNFSVRITGGPFMRSHQLRCRFGEVIVEGVYVDGEEINCYAPPHEAGVYALEVSVNDQDYGDIRFPFRYYKQESLSRVMPVSGPAYAAGTEVTLYGNGFVNTTLLVCRFGHTVVPAIFKSSSEIICRTPPLHPDSCGLKWLSLSEQRNRNPDPLTGSRLLFPSAHPYPLYLCRLVTVEVSSNGQDFTGSGINYLYQADSHVISVNPEKTLDLGNSPVFVHGTNFVNSTTLTCRIGGYIMKATYISRELLICMTPALAVREPQQGFLDHGRLWMEDFPQAALTRTSPLGASPSEVFVEISLNSLDYTSDRVVLNIEGPCPTGFFCSGNDLRLKLPCPRGTFCPGEGNTNFTVCPRGMYQPQDGQSSCLRCPIGFCCPEYGLQVPRICPAGE